MIFKEKILNWKRYNFFKEHRFLIFLFLLILSLIVYKNFIGMFFFSDDFIWIHHGELIKQNFSEVIKLRFTTFYSPVVNFYFFAMQSLFGNNYVAYHLVGILLHGINSFLIYLFLDKIIKNKLAALLGAVYFAVSFYHFEAIIWIAAILHILVTLWILLGLYFYLKFFEKKNIWFLATSLFCGFLAIITKESGIIFPVLIFGLYVFLQKKKIFKFYNFKHLISYGVLLIAFVVYSYIMQRENVLIDVGNYILSIKAIYPLSGSLLGLLDVNMANYAVSRPIVLYTLVFITFLFLLIIFYKKRDIFRLICLGLFLSICSFAPVMFFYFGTWHTISQHRYSYLPSIGGAVVFSALFLLLKNYFEKRRFFTFVMYCFFSLFLLHNVFLVSSQYTNNYDIIDRQMEGMLSSFSELKPIIGNREVVVLRPYPFRYNEYYRFMYKYFVDRSKTIDSWRAENNIIGVELDSFLVLSWNNHNMSFYQVSEK